jgi:hypothetical protein
MKGLTSIENLGYKLNCSREYFIFPDHQYFGVDTKTEIFLPTSKQNCDHLFGEQYVFTSCTNRCKNSSCPLRNIPRYEFCPYQYLERTGTIANNEYLAFFTKSHGNIFTNRYFVCDNKIMCLEYSQVCDLVDDCGDGSDEESCTNHFRCNSSDRYISKTQQCDGKFDCEDLSDECSEFCSRQILEGRFLKVISWLLGLLAVGANSIIIMKSFYTLRRSKNSVVFVNKSLVILISFGDFLVSCYLVTVAVYDGVVFKNNYCKKQIEWIVSTSCSVIGVVSTIGSQVSLFSMTVLSFVRVYVITNSKKIPGKVTLTTSLQILSGVMLLIIISIVIAIVPIISKFEDFFVNGIKFADELKLFTGTQNKRKIMLVLEAYHGRMMKTTLSWRTVLESVSSMFSHDIGYKDHTVTAKKVDFYGNDGVCLFKYFVDMKDPQRSFVWGILALNFLCFLSISISYIVIVLTSRRSSQSTSKSKEKKKATNRTKKMNQRIAFIITTDFICWVPFIIICTLHSLEVLNATPWYSIFSMVILPINSVINPLIYDDTVTNLIVLPLNKLKNSVSNLANTCSTVVKETIELEQAEIAESKIESNTAESCT